MRAKISARQLFTGIILIPYGSAILFFINSDAKRDAWIAMLIYIFPAIILQLIYTSLWSKYPNDTIVTYMPKIFGKVIGYIISIIYIIFFEYESIRVLRDFTDFILIATMPRVPKYLVPVLLISAIGYGVYLGMENIFRMVHFFFYICLAFFFIEWVFLFITPHALKFYHLMPIFENGISSVITKSWSLLTFPFGQTILFTMFFPYVVERSKVRKAAILAIIFEGILLSLSIVLFISVLGVEYATTSLFPIVQTLRMIKIGTSFDRIDIFLTFIIVIIGFIKASFLLYGAMLGTAQLLKLKDTKNLAILFSILCFVGSIFVAKNYPQHINIGLKWIPIHVSFPLEDIIPVIALVTYYFKKIINI